MSKEGAPAGSEAPFTTEPPAGSFGTPLPSRLRRRPSSRRRRRLLLALGIFGLFLVWFVPPVYKLRGGSVTVTRWEKKKGKTEAVVGHDEKGWVSTKKISRHTLNAIIAAEDGKFYEHGGIDWEALQASAKLNWKKKRYVRGGSTISQQVVKMAFLDREKSLIRKAREGVGTLLMELILPKEKILEWYINLAEFGDGVYGVAAGSWHYFKTKPELLTVEQAVHLALVLPSPNRWSNGLRKRALTPFGHRRFAAILNNMKMSGHISKGQWINAVTRGDFGRPITGYAKLLAAEETQKPLCPGHPSCPDEAEEADGGMDDEEEIAFPKVTQPAPQPVPDPSTSAPASPAESTSTPSSPSAPTTTATGVTVDPSAVEIAPAPAPAEPAAAAAPAPPPPPPPAPPAEDF